MVLVELCAGTASVSLRALAGHPMPPPVGYMGSKRRFATSIVDLLGFGSAVPDRVVLVDAGPWGDVWNTLRVRDLRHGVIATFDGWRDEDPHALWQRLVLGIPSDDPVERVSQYLWLQARSAGTIPIWFNADRGRWESPTGSRTEAAHERGGASAHNREVGDHRVGRPAEKSARDLARPYEAGGLQRLRDETEGSRKIGRANDKQSSDASKRQKQKGVRGIQHPATIARRLERLDRLPWDRVEVITTDLRDVDPIPGSIVYFDPPYRNCPRYAAICPRSDVVDVSLRWAAAGASVLVSEGERLDLEGWSHARLSSQDRTSAGGGGVVRREEWLTASWPISIPQQLELLEVA